MPLYDLDIAKLFTALGGPAEIHRKLKQAGYSGLPTVKGVQKWRERKKLSSCWLVALLSLPAVGGDAPLDIKNYIMEVRPDDR